jgi:hypothetical protein
MSNDMIVPLSVVRVDNITGTVVSTEDGEQLAYLTLRSGEDVINFVVPSKEQACHLSALMLNLSDHMP